jgi:hypothetical protein
MVEPSLRSGSEFETADAAGTPARGPPGLGTGARAPPSGGGRSLCDFPCFSAFLGPTIDQVRRDLAGRDPLVRPGFGVRVGEGERVFLPPFRIGATREVPGLWVYPRQAAPWPRASRCVPAVSGRPSPREDELARYRFRPPGASEEPGSRVGRRRPGRERGLARPPSVGAADVSATERHFPRCRRAG